MAAAPLGAQTARGPFDGQVLPLQGYSRNEFKPEEQPVREINIVKDAPLFANLPFLRLRSGDQLVKGRTGWKDIKSGETRETDGFFLKRGGQYQKIWADERDGKRVLTEWESLGFFDWDVNQVNAEKLWLWSREASERLTIEQLRNLETALLPEFAEHLSRDWQFFTEFEKFSRSSFGDDAAPIPAPGFLYAVTGDLKWPGRNFLFAGLGFDAHNATFYVFQMRFGQAGAVRRKKPILVGPEPVNGIEFGDWGVPNGSGTPPATGRKLARLQAQQARHEKFRDIVAKVLRDGAA